MSRLDLDVETPEEVSKVLQNAAQAYYETVEHLQGAWQDKNAGKVWGKIARILERAADSVDKVVK